MFFFLHLEISCPQTSFPITFFSGKLEEPNIALDNLVLGSHLEQVTVVLSFPHLQLKITNPDKKNLKPINLNKKQK